MRIDRNIRVDQNHLKASASATARLSLMLSMLANRNLPSATLFVLNGSRWLGRVVKIAQSSAQSLIDDVFQGCIARPRNRSIAAATSSSSIRVVLMHQNKRLSMR
jgi:hypothetical protein